MVPAQAPSSVWRRRPVWRAIMFAIALPLAGIMFVFGVSAMFLLSAASQAMGSDDDPSDTAESAWSAGRGAARKVWRMFFGAPDQNGEETGGEV